MRRENLKSRRSDALFLPTLAFVVAREVIAGRNWQNLRVTAGVTVLGGLNIGFHVAVLVGGDAELVIRAAVALYVALICQVGGRIIPSFTRNLLARAGVARLPAPASLFDQFAMLSVVVAGLSWTAPPQSPITSLACVLAAALHAIRLARWRGIAGWREPLLLVLHVGYAFVPLGLVAVALSSFGLIASASALHLLTVGAIGVTTLAVMTRATRGHTGRPLKASRATTIAYGSLVAAAVLRPIAELLPDFYHPILAVSGTCWMAAFGLFVIEHAPMLARRSA